MNFCWQSMPLLLNMLSRLVITFLPRSEESEVAQSCLTLCDLRSKHLLISCLQSPSAVILEPPKNKVWHCFHCFPIYFPWSDGNGCHDLRFLNVEFKPTFSLSSFTFIKRLFSSSSLSAIRVVSSAIWGYWYFSQQSWFQLVLLPAQHLSWCTLHIS